jgi:3-phosphoshikimate 1-carboxyvinyltransferase
VTSPLWNAPLARGPVLAEVRVPGSKSMTNRALILAALADGTSTVRQPLISRDCALMIGALTALGVGVDTASDTAWTITPGELGPGVVTVGNAGTVLRFVTAIAPLVDGAVSIDGDDAVRRRPVGPLLEALRSLGAEIDDGGRGFAPYVVSGRGSLPGGRVQLDASSSSQLVSALLLAGARYDDGVVVQHVGERNVPNANHVAMTIQMLTDRGVSVSTEAGRWSLSPGRVAAVDRTIEPDLSSAAPFLAAAVVTAGQVTIPDWPKDSTQPGATLPALLEAFGATTIVTADGLVVRGGDTVTGADLDLRDCGELTPVLAAVAATASTPSRLLGIDYLRGHETDRLAALARELTALGAIVTELDDGLEITPKALHGNVFSTYDDHRMAMAAAVLGLVVPDLQVENVETTAKTFPGFAARWDAAVEASGVTH